MQFVTSERISFSVLLLRSRHFHASAFCRSDHVEVICDLHPGSSGTWMDPNVSMCYLRQRTNTQKCDDLNKKILKDVLSFVAECITVSD